MTCPDCRDFGSVHCDQHSGRSLECAECGAIDADLGAYDLCRGCAAGEDEGCEALAVEVL